MSSGLQSGSSEMLEPSLDPASHSKEQFSPTKGLVYPSSSRADHLEATIPERGTYIAYQPPEDRSSICSAIWLSPQPYLVTDTCGRVLSANPAFCALVGYDERELRRRDSVLDLVPAEWHKQHIAKIEETYQSGQALSYHAELLRKDGSLVPVQLQIWLGTDPRHLYAFVTDITDRVQAEKALRASESLLRLLAENASDIIYRYQLHPEMRYEYLSPAVTKVTGYSPEEYAANPRLIIQVVHPDDVHLLSAVVSGAFTFDKPLTLRCVRKDGGIVWIEQMMTPSYNDQGRLIAIEGIARDITERKRIEEQLQYLSLHDALTGLYSRGYFQEEMQRLQGSRDYPVTIVSLDVDGLKLINDTLGHRRGDDLLRACAQVLRTTFRKSDVVARIGGDEFAVILPRTDCNGGDSLCERLYKEIEVYNQAHPNLPLTVSVGVASTPTPEVALEETLSQADKNMYRDKLRRATNSTHSIMQALLTALAAKDYFEQGHASRVAESARQLGEAIGLSQKELLDLALLAEVHDLGKVGVPDRILFKEEALTEDEREQIRQHAAIGYRIARSSPALSHIADLILHHHEWWNGNGYPIGLRGEEIPTACRILAIADALDAMTSQRPYRPAMSLEEAMLALKAGAGTQFDPYLVEKLMAIAEKR